MPNLRDEPIATWQQAMDNIRAGQIRLKNNVPFTMTGFKYGQEKFINTPSIILEVSCDVPNESVIEFKDGSLFGFEFLGPDTQYMYAVRMFIYFPEYEVIGHTNRGTPYTWVRNDGCINWVEDHDQTATLTLPVTRCAMSFGMFLNNDGSIDMDSYNLKYIIYPTQAIGATLQWDYNYTDAMQWHDRGTFGYREADSHIVDWLCGQFSPPAVYPGDPSATGGGSGYFYSQNDVIGIPNLPTIEAIDFGFSSIYNPSVSEMQAIAAWLWSDDFDENIKMNYISPFDNIIGIALVPINVPSSAGILRIGNVDSNIAVNRVYSQYGEIDCGALDVHEFWGSFLDYNASYSIYLPFIGYRGLKADDLVNGEIGVVYHYDLLSGLVVAFIWTIKEDGIKHVLYTYTGNMFYNVAFSGANFMSLYNQQLSATTSGINNAVNAVTSLATGNLSGALSSIMEIGHAQRQYETAKPDYGRGGNNGGNAGIFSIRYPYLIQSLPIGQPPKNYMAYNGAPAQVYDHLENLHGYTEVDRIALDNLNISTAEKNELEQLLKAGVYLP